MGPGDPWRSAAVGEVLMDTGDDHGSIILLEVGVLHVEEEIWIFILGIWHRLRHVFEFGLLIELKIINLIIPRLF